MTGLRRESETVTEYLGIDVAKWQGTIDWAKVKKAGVKLAILKVTQKNNTVESAFERNYAGCKAQNIPVGLLPLRLRQNGL